MIQEIISAGVSVYRFLQAEQNHNAALAEAYAKEHAAWMAYWNIYSFQEQFLEAYPNNIKRLGALIEAADYGSDFSGSVDPTLYNLCLLYANDKTKIPTTPEEGVALKGENYFRPGTLIVEPFYRENWPLTWYPTISARDLIEDIGHSPYSLTDLTKADITTIQQTLSLLINCAVAKIESYGKWRKTSMYYDEKGILQITFDRPAVEGGYITTPEGVITYKQFYAELAAKQEAEDLYKLILARFDDMAKNITFKGDANSADDVAAFKNIVDIVNKPRLDNTYVTAEYLKTATIAYNSYTGKSLSETVSTASGVSPWVLLAAAAAALFIL